MEEITFDSAETIPYKYLDPSMSEKSTINVPLNFFSHAQNCQALFLRIKNSKWKSAHERLNVTKTITEIIQFNNKTIPQHAQK